MFVIIFKSNFDLEFLHLHVYHIEYMHVTNDNIYFYTYIQLTTAKSSAMLTLTFILTSSLKFHIQF